MNRFLSFLRRHRLEAIALFDGAIIMMMELVGARMIAPYLGTSTYVWTAVIGVILGALATGYWYGGRLADRAATMDILTKIFIVAASVLLVSLTVQAPLLSFLSSMEVDLRVQALFAALLLFAPAAIFMGMVSPYLAKLKVTSLNSTGRSVGSLYAAGTAGSILGTFAAGYWLIAFFGSQTLGWLLVVALILLSFGVNHRTYVLLRAIVLVAVVVAAVVTPMINVSSVNILYDGDSAYARYQVLEGEANGSKTHLLKTDNVGIQSGVSLDNPLAPIFDYAKRFIEAAEGSPQPERILMIGGGTFTVPTILSDVYPNTQIDVVEIDPQLTALATQYFFYTPKPNIKIINQDGRVFLNQNTTTYDIIYVDAYTALTPPFQLTTREAVSRMKNSLNPNGVIVANLVGAPQGNGSDFSQAAYATYADVLPSVSWYRAASTERPLNVRQNIILLATRDASVVEHFEKQWRSYRIDVPATQQSDILTDNFAPVEHMTARY